MSRPSRIKYAIPASLLVLTVQAAAGAADTRSLDCQSSFPASSSAKLLEDRFGRDQVSRVDIEVGEGQVERGTVLFGSTPNARVEILWKDAAGQRNPRVVRIRGDASTWRAAGSLALGDDLRSVERRNGRPFLLAGFGWDCGGTQLSWSGGRLESAASAACAVRIRLAPRRTPYTGRWEEQVQGDREFSSSHPAMQALNPRIYEIWLQY